MAEVAHLIQLGVKGPDTIVASGLCASCPHSPAGCCVAPPRYDWSDIGRVVHHGRIDFILAGLASGALVACEHGLFIKRVKGRVTPERGAPRIAKCSFHDGRSGCTIDPLERPATCNFYVCESALQSGVEAGGAREVARARRVHDELVDAFVRWDARTAAAVKATYPDGPPFDRVFLEWLGRSFAEHLAADPPPSSG